MSNKIQARLRRCKKTRAKIARTGIARLVVRRTNQHVYASVILPDDNGTRVAATVSTLESALKDQLSGSMKEKASTIGKVIAERSKKAGIERVAFDRSGFKYHGCVKALAEAAREGGINF